MEDDEFHAGEVGEVVNEQYVVVRDDEFIGVAIDRFREFEPEDEEATVCSFGLAATVLPELL